MNIHEPEAGRCAVTIPAGTALLRGELCLPAVPRAAVLFVHGAGSGCDSPRARAIAPELHRIDIATLRFDLLSEAERERDFATASLRYNIPLLADRVVTVTDWLCHHPAIGSLPLGYMGAGTGAAAALVASIARADIVHAIVCRSGRPDLVAASLSRVQSPTLLIVADRDAPLTLVNHEAFTTLACEKELVSIEGASRLYEEDEALEKVAQLAAEWFGKHLLRPRAVPQAGRVTERESAASRHA